MRKQLAAIFFLFTSLTALLLLSGCSKHISIANGHNVSMTADGKRMHLPDRLTTGDFIALAGGVAEQMLASKVVQKWKEPPLIVVARPENSTHQANILTEDMQDEIIARILDAGTARVLDEENLAFRYDYIIKTTITDTVQSITPRPENNTGNLQLISYTCRMQLYSLRGERIGQWHDSIQMLKSPTTPR